MKIVLFDEINETHVCDALAVALARLGHQVIRTGPVWRGHLFATEAADLARIHGQVDECIAQAPDALLNFRASSLAPGQVERLRRAGVRTAVWFPDDPVLYGLCYSHVVDAYDTVLHCAGRRVLDFYRYRGHRIGINFPFWLDTDVWACAYEAARCEAALVFYGNMHGPAKQGRYELFCGLDDDLSLYGRVPDDPRGKGRGTLAGPAAAVAVLPRYRIGLNSPQRFADYAGTPYDFPGLAMLGSFFLPSRVLQYAAIGLPVLTLHPHGIAAEHYPPGLHATDASQARGVVQRVARDVGYLQALSRAARGEVERCHGAPARARLLVKLFDTSIQPEQLTPHEQEFIHRIV